MTSLARILLTGSRTWPDVPLLEDTLLNVWHDALQRRRLASRSSP